MLDFLLWIVGLAGVAVVYADVLVRPGMLLEGVQRWLRNQYFKAHWRYGEQEHPAQTNLDEQWWWPPLWGCFKCVAGQWGAWGYLLYLWRHLPTGAGWRGAWAAYSLPGHLAFAAFTIIVAIILHKWTQE